MPIYEYRCASCGHQQEFLLKVSDAPPAVCTKCGKPSLSKMVTAAGFQLKGSGWYATDFKNAGAKPAAKPADATKSDVAPGGDARGNVATSGDAKGNATPSGDAKGNAAPSGDAKGNAAPSGDANSGGEKKAAASRGAGGSPAC
jgi:putative FmdB family regulatory protein